MQKTLINSASKKWVNAIELPDDWSGADDEWQIPSGHEFVNGIGATGRTWDGSSFNMPTPLSDEENAARRNASSAKDKILVLESDVTQRRLRDAHLTEDGKKWLDDQEKLIAVERAKL